MAPPCVLLELHAHARALLTTRLFRSEVRGCLLLLVTVAASGACDRLGTPPGVVSVPQIRTGDVQRVVSGAAAAALQSNGEFRLPVPSNPPGSILTETAARELAITWARQFGPLNRHGLEKEHGGPIDPEKLEPCGRAYFAESPYEPLPDDAPVPFRNVFGPWWLFTLCEGGVPEVSLAVAASATTMRVIDGRLSFPREHGSEFVWMGIPAGGELPVGPEAAVVAVARESGERVVGVPELVASGSFEVPQMARWRVKLEHPAAAVIPGNGSALRTASEVWVGTARDTRAATSAVASANEPAVREHTYRLPPLKLGGPERSYTVRVRRRSGYPWHVDAVALQRTGRSQ